MSEMVPMYGFGGGGSGAGGTLTVTAPASVTVTVSKDGKTKTKVAGSDGIVVFKGLASGSWTVTITDGSQTAQKVAAINTDYALVISFNTIPEFTYTGDYEIVNDADEPITASQDNWKIRFLTSGTLTITALNGAENGIDVFCVGGGGNGASGGGGGGYTSTQKGVILYAGTEISIEIGGSGGNTSAFGITAKAGANANGFNGGAGGSGGGSLIKAGGSDGGDGGTQASYTGGTGQGTTTREFGEENGRLYAGGGGGAGGAGSGGSGIVIIRNAREVA